MILTTLVVAIGLGIAAQVAAERFQLPAILPLLLLGILCGPSGLRWFDPGSLHGFLEVLVELGVAVILFEGGLSANSKRMASVGVSVWNLATLGVAVTGFGAAWLAHALAGMSWPTAALFGAIMTVTGPTVIGPLLRHMVAPRPLKTLLVAEGLITDAIGAVLAYLVLQWIQRASVPWQSLAGEMAELALTGAVLGFAAGSLARVVLRHRVVTGELSNLVVLSLVVLCFMVSEHRAPQSGVLAVVVMGFTLAAADLPDLAPLRSFKGQLTTLIISVLFILLAGQLDLAAVAGLGLAGVAVVAGLIVLVRPAAVMVSVWPGQLGGRERLALALTAPRGIVAAAVASLAARELERSGLAGGTALEGLVYLAILVTGAWATLMALLLPPVLGYTRDPRRRRVVLVGANALTEALAGVLAARGRTAVTIDDSPRRLRRLRRAGHAVVLGDARQATAFEEAGVERDTAVVAATTNDELNLLVAQRVRGEFGVEHPVAVLQEPPEDLGRRSRAWLDLVGGGRVDLPLWLDRLRDGAALVLTVDLRDEAVRSAVKEAGSEEDGALVPLLGWVGGEPAFRLPAAGIDGWDEAVVLVGAGPAAEALRRAGTAVPPGEAAAAPG